MHWSWRMTLTETWEENLFIHHVFIEYLLCIQYSSRRWQSTPHGTDSYSYGIFVWVFSPLRSPSTLRLGCGVTADRGCSALLGTFWETQVGILPLRGEEAGPPLQSVVGWVWPMEHKLWPVQLAPLTSRDAGSSHYVWELFVDDRSVVGECMWAGCQRANYNKSSTDK